MNPEFRHLEGNPSMLDDIHKHWRFVAFDAYNEENRMIEWPVTVTVDGYDNEDDALLVAKSIVSRQHYRLQAVWECSTCRFQARTLAAAEKIANA